MKRGFKKIGKPYCIGMVWLLGLLWPLTGIHPDGTLSIDRTVSLWGYLFLLSLVGLAVYLLKTSTTLHKAAQPLVVACKNTFQRAGHRLPAKVWGIIFLLILLAYPHSVDRYGTDIAINVLLYICLGLGLNMVVGLAGMLDLGYIAFYGVGAYTYALLNTIYGVPFWFCLPFCALFAGIAGAIVVYPTLRMRGDYLAIVTLGFAEITRILLNNWMELTNGPNGILGIDRIAFFRIVFDGGISVETMWVKKLQLFYYFILAFAVLVIIAVNRLHYSRVGRAWEAIREDETAAGLMGIDTLRYKFMAYSMGAFFAGLAGAFFAARLRFTSPESFTFLESAMVLCMVVLGGMGSVPGILLAVVALIALPEFFREFESFRMLIFGASMVTMMLVRPAGLIPDKRKKHMATQQGTRQ